jgi:anti-sigma regulatory factor (Ser/Thr protein kinase)/DNA-binding transcriptional ArsR family regulator
MSPRSRQNPLVREFILRNVAEHPGNIGPLAVKKFGLSRAAVNRYMRRLIEEGLLTAKGKTRARRYELKDTVNFRLRMTDITRHSEEDVIWRFKVLPEISNISKNIVDVCHYGFTEMLNNVIDHSLSSDAIICYEQNYCKVSMYVIDYGVGIFSKIQKDFNLSDPRSALLELSKGKLTSDKKQHSGWGIYFTSRMFDQFQIRSGDLFYTRERRDKDDWLIETGDIREHVNGTWIYMGISTDAQWTTREVFDKYQGDDFEFRKTHVPVKLGNYPGEQLVSRSQAKRVLARFDQFSEIILDFHGVEDIGQPFADEIFRIFHNAHPEIEILAVRTNPEIRKMIEFVRESAREKIT